MKKKYSSHGNGSFKKKDFLSYGKNIIIEKHVLIFHPETINLGNNIYIGHNTIIKSYYKGSINIGNDTWIGQNCFFHGAGNIEIGNSIGIGPCVNIITSYHDYYKKDKMIIKNKLLFKNVKIGSGSDIGIGTKILPGVKIGKGCMIGAGSVVNIDIPNYHLASGNPIKIIKKIN